MLTIKELIQRSESTMDENKFQDFLINTIKTCGYNSDTFSLFEKLNNSLRVQKYKDSIVGNINQCSREKGNSENIISSLPKTYDDLEKKINDKISKEELDGILFDANIEMVDDYLQYNKLNGISIKNNVDNYLEAFKTGMNQIDNSQDFEQVRNDLYEDAGISQIGLESLEEDTSIFMNEGLFSDEEELSIEQELTK